MSDAPYVPETTESPAIRLEPEATEPPPPAPDSDHEPIRLGGMAMRNGLLIHGPTGWAAAVRKRSGELEVASGKKPTLSHGAVGKIPMLRGPVRLGEAMAVLPLVRLRLRSARMAFEDPRVIVVGALAQAITSWVRRDGRSGPREELIAGLIGIVPALAALRDRDLAAYHGAEHKAIGAYESGATIEATPKEHRRCGSNIVFPLMTLSAAGQLLVEATVDEPGPVVRALAGLAAVGGAVELFANAEKHPDTLLGRSVQVPGHEIQRLVSTREPTPAQIEVGDAALREILRVEGAPDRRSNTLT
ncbi:DUF1385 domain-containing protein [Thermoleophilia bacterium SCSIO 60948]|nr:DUF1385 domain-containing protein [Thermoleophilia bacterium SCSIO 60948]